MFSVLLALVVLFSLLIIPKFDVFCCLVVYYPLALCIVLLFLACQYIIYIVYSDFFQQSRGLLFSSQFLELLCWWNIISLYQGLTNPKVVIVNVSLNTLSKCCLGFICPSWVYYYCCCFCWVFEFERCFLVLVLYSLVVVVVLFWSGHRICVGYETNDEGKNLNLYLSKSPHCILDSCIMNQPSLWTIIFNKLYPMG